MTKYEYLLDVSYHQEGSNFFGKATVKAETEEKAKEKVKQMYSDKEDVHVGNPKTLPPII